MHAYDCKAGRADNASWWQATCACGWTGEKRDNYNDPHRDYQEHVFAVVGLEQAYYEAPVRCVNCAFDGPANLLIGTSVWHGTCPRCMASGRLRPNNEAHDEEIERTRGWRF